MPKYAAFAFLVLSTFAATSNASADTRLGDSCDLSIFGVKDKSEFLRFDNTLRSALSRRDAAALALVVKFPLRLNHSDGSSISLNDAATLQLRFAEAFPASLRGIVLAQKPDALFCRSDGVMYGNGELWVGLGEAGESPQFRVSAINLPGPARQATAKPAEAKVQLACSTDKFHIVVDRGPDRASRYRSWNKPHAPPDKPALELMGTQDGLGNRE